ncbi:hypothetical protein Glove_243g51 [Diversispora epigaea]|uniref:DNA topoisomerase (ATP-hydrolyzing) n=1 Tax=Diversispora epigaea TaxID=1348612 RepID=A0A397I919_9GLOM|nr:hypothetical protein Glove_243g51 [Diversispora epigaea]
MEISSSLESIQENEEEFWATTFRPRDWVIQRIESMIEKIISDIAIGIPPVINSVSNASRKEESHSGYDVRNGIIRRKNNKRDIKKISFLGSKSTRGFVIFVRILDICHELLIQGVTATKRDIYYKDVQLFGSQHTVDQAIEELACLFRVPRACLNVTVSAKGLVAGNLKIYQKDKSLLDCTAISSMGTLIPTMDLIENILFFPFFFNVIYHYMNSENSLMATFQYLLSSGIFERFGPCVLITGKGYPDIATRQLVKQLSEYRKQHESKECEYENSRIEIPILGFFDNDPYGIEILSIYKYGSQAMSFDNGNLATTNIKWIGLHCIDWKRDEICRTLYTGKKAEMQSLCYRENMDLLNYLKSKIMNPQTWL